MFDFIETLPPDVLGIRATGRITADDYRDLLLPRLNAKLAEHDRIKVLFVAPQEFRGYTADAAWQDAQAGVKHWRDISRIAVVTNSVWLRAAAHMLSPFFPGDIRVFALTERTAAQNWLLRGPTAQTAPEPHQENMVERDVINPTLYNVGEVVREFEEGRE